MHSEEIIFSRRIAIDKITQTLLANAIATGNRIVTILHSILRTTGKELANIRPLVSHLDLSIDQNLVLLLCPDLLRHIWTQVVEPTLTTLEVNTIPQFIPVFRFFR